METYFFPQTILPKLPFLSSQGLFLKKKIWVVHFTVYLVFSEQPSLLLSISLKHFLLLCSVTSCFFISLLHFSGSSVSVYPLNIYFFFYVFLCKREYITFWKVLCIYSFEEERRYIHIFSIVKVQ